MMISHCQNLLQDTQPFSKSPSFHHKNFAPTLFIYPLFNMYLATQFTWSSVRDLHAAMLFEIECVRADQGDSFTHLESRILQAPVKPSSQAGVSRTESSTAVFFCRDFQHGACKLNKDHYGTLRGEWKWLQHICARCWVDSRVAARHTEFSKECPLAVDKDSNSSGTTAP